MKSYDPDRKWAYQEPAGDRNPDDPNAAIVVVMSEREIIETYWDFWRAEMKRVGREELITRENCIADWIVIHWAAEA